MREEERERQWEVRERGGRGGERRDGDREGRREVK